MMSWDGDAIYAQMYMPGHAWSTSSCCMPGAECTSEANFTAFE